MIRKAILILSSTLACGVAALALTSIWYWIGGEFCPTDHAVAIVALAGTNLVIFCEETEDPKIIENLKRYLAQQHREGTSYIKFSPIAQHRRALRTYFRRSTQGQKIWGPVKQTFLRISLWPFVVAFSVYPLIALIRGPLRRRYSRRYRRERGLCVKCGYDLTGNVSGVCPECGTEIQRP